MFGVNGLKDRVDDLEIVIDDMVKEIAQLKAALKDANEITVPTTEKSLDGKNKLVSVRVKDLMAELLRGMAVTAVAVPASNQQIVLVQNQPKPQAAPTAPQSNKQEGETQNDKADSNVH